MLAESTVFYSHEGLNLVRFTVTGYEAPAGRLRVFDADGRFLGTSGVLPGEHGLYGELWLPVDRPRVLVTELEMPDQPTRRGRHRINPARRWTLHWLTLIPPAAAAGLDPDGAADLRGVFVDPLGGTQFAYDSHLEPMTVFREAAAVARARELRVGDVAAAETGAFTLSTTPGYLRSAGVSLVVVPSWVADRFQVMRSPAGAELLAASVPGDRSPEMLAFGEGGYPMQRAVERLLNMGSSSADEALTDSLLLVDYEVTPDRDEMLAMVDEWNSRFGFPRIVVGEPGVFSSAVSGAAAMVPVVELRERPLQYAPRSAALEPLRTERRDRLRQDSEASGAAVASLMVPGESDLSAVANRLATSIPGFLVVNPTPFPRTDHVQLPDGNEVIVTDVPALGYAFVPSMRRPAPNIIEDDQLQIESRTLVLRVDPATGTIMSLLTRDSGFEWVRPGSNGLNVVERTSLTGVRRRVVAGVSQSLELQMWSSARGSVRTEIRMYDALPWIDVRNYSDAVGGRAVRYGYHWNLDGSRIRWEVPGGSADSTDDARLMRHLRWIELRDPAHKALLRCLDTALFSATAEGDVEFLAPRGETRLRLQPIDSLGLRNDPWEFGWSADRLIVIPVEGGGTGMLPSFGSVLRLDRGEIIIAALEPHPEEPGVIAYLLDLHGNGGSVTVTGGVRALSRARRLSLLHRPITELPVEGGSVRIEVPARGLAAVHLS